MQKILEENLRSYLENAKPSIGKIDESDTDLSDTGEPENQSDETDIMVMDEDDESQYLNKNNVTPLIVFLSFVMCIIAFFAISIFDEDRVVSEKENRVLESFPNISISNVMSGKFMEHFEKYYSDTFPYRDEFLEINSHIKKFTSQFVGEKDGVVVIDTEKSEDDFSGEALNENQR